MVAMDDLVAVIDQAIEQNQGILKLRPNYVCRYYRSGGRLPLGEQATLAEGRRQSRWVPERWLASTVAALNPDPIPGEGLSVLNIPERDITLKQALSVRPNRF